MAQVQVLLPKMGESVAEATITTWLKNVGDSVDAEESLVEIATDKVDSEVPAPEDGVITEILCAEEAARPARGMARNVSIETNVGWITTRRSNRSEMSFAAMNGVVPNVA